jgi:O-antigen/teichoic acid export membrane protein
VKKAIHKAYNKVGIKSDRTKNITKHVLLSFVYKGGSILASFLLVPLTINYLDTENYGIWLTLSSFIAWFSFFDIGLGNGLRNKFAEAKAKGDMTLAKGYVSSAYFTIGAVSLSLIIIFTLLNFFIDWTKVFNASPSLQKDLSLLMPIVFGFFCLQLVVKLITTIYTADQHHSMQGKINFFTQAGSLLLIWIMTKTSESSLLVFGVIFSALPVVILIWFNLFAFNKRYIDFKPSIKFWKKEYLKEIFGLGMKFFMIQMAGIVLFSTDNFIISHLYGPQSVVPFNIAFKYLSIANMAMAIILTPYWSSITDAYTKNDYEWIKKSMKSLTMFSIISSVVICIMILISPFVYELWIGSDLQIPFSLTIYIGLFFILTIFYAPYTYFINGTGKVYLQLISIVSTSIINIPLSVFFAKNLNFGVSGVIIATIICLIPHIILCPIQYSKIINKKAYGIWNK